MRNRLRGGSGGGFAGGFLGWFYDARKKINIVKRIIHIKLISHTKL